MGNFSFRRLLLTMRYLGSLSWLRYLTFAGIMFIATMAVFFISWTSDSVYANNYPDVAVFFPYSIILGFFLTACFAQMTDGFQSKRDKDVSRLLLLPASNAEKFVASFFMNVITPTIFLSVAFHAAVLVMSPEVFLKFLTRGGIFPFFHFLTDSYNLIDVDEADASSTILGIKLITLLSPILIAATFLFGGTLFSRAKWLLTSLSILIINSIFAHIAFKVVCDIDFNEYTFNVPALVWWTVTLMFVLSALFIWGSYRLFCRRQAAKGSLFNV